MKFSEKQYTSNLNYIKGIFSLGGLSECGKTSAGKYLDSIGVKRIKIIHIEKEMMIERNYDISNGMQHFHFINLYKDSPNEVFKEFLFKLIEMMKEANVQYASIESLYRAELGLFLKQELGEKMVNIYIEAPVEVRAARELIKVNTEASKEKLPLITLDEMIVKVKEKDAFKIENNAQKVKDIADYIIDNSADVSKEQFIEKIGYIADKFDIVRIL
ncbi:MAG: hypothetical protein K0S55_879 [Clostridia bacterium]|jgi:hypothetical protein|nr:hypothetical protein [Clostridia bacterium]